MGDLILSILLLLALIAVIILALYNKKDIACKDGQEHDNKTVLEEWIPYEVCKKCGRKRQFTPFIF